MKRTALAAALVLAFVAIGTAAESAILEMLARNTRIKTMQAPTASLAAALHLPAAGGRAAATKGLKAITQIFVPDYWPQPSFLKPIAFTYFNKNGAPMNEVSVFSRQPDGTIWEDDYLNGSWKGRWLLRYDIMRGVIEFGDDYPTSGVEKPVLGDVKKKRFLSGSEILWGGHQLTGSTLDVRVRMDVLGSHMLPGTAAFEKGHQFVHFAEILPSFVDVLGQTHGETLLLFYQQDWNGGAPTGALYWLEKGVGPVQIHWAGNYQLVGDPIAAKVS